MKAITMIGALAVLAACASTPNHEEIVRDLYNVPSSGVSEFDGTRYVRMSDVTCMGRETIMFDLYQDSRHVDAGEFIIKVKIPGTVSIARGESLHFNIDGEIVSLASPDLTTSSLQLMPAISSPGMLVGRTYIPGQHVRGVHGSSKRYRADIELISRIAEAERVVARVDLADTRVEGVCSPEAELYDAQTEWLLEYTGTAGFRQFGEMISTL